MGVNKKLITLIITSVLVLITTISVYAGSADPTSAMGGQPGSGGTGPYSLPAIMLKIQFETPSIYGVTEADYKTKIGGIVGARTEDISLDSAYLFMKGSGFDDRPNMEGMWVSEGGTDSRQRAQMYMYGTKGYKPLRFQTGGNIWTFYNQTNHYGIYGASTSAGRTKVYRNQDSILSVNSVFMKELLLVTKNGTIWDGDAIAQCMQRLHDTYVITGAPRSTEVVKHRIELASMFSGWDSGGTSSSGNWPDASEYIKEVFMVQNKKGSTPPGAAFSITTVEQSAIINNLVMASIGLTFLNPADGVALQGYGTVNNSYKGDWVLNKLMSWARAGGNSDKSIEHLTFKLEVYSQKGGGGDHVTRWDNSFFYNSKGSIHSLMSTPPNFNLENGDINRYGYDAKYNYSSNAVRYNRMSTQAIIDSHKKHGSPITRYDGWVARGSAWGIFQQPFINSQGNIWDNGVPNFSYRSIVQMASPIYYNGIRTMNLGFGYISPSSPFTGAPGAAPIPNLLLNSQAFTETQEVPKNTKATATSYTDFMFVNKPSDQTKNAYALKWEDNTWNAPSSEVQALLRLIERTQAAGEATGGLENKSLPVTLTIRRSIANGKGNTDRKMIDDNYNGSTTVKTCGKHNYKIVSDDGATAVITYNLVPTGGNCSYPKGQYQFISSLKTAAGAVGPAAITTINNCAIATLYEDAGSRIKFNDSNIDITDTPGGITTVNYDYTMSMKSPTFKLNEKAYGAANIDKMMNKPLYTSLGHSVLPEGGAVYPTTDWTGGYYRSSTIRRSVTFTRVPEAPNYTNLGYEKKLPHYSEIKQGAPSNEKFEAMSGTPTTRDLYMSVSGTDFRVDLNSEKDAKINPDTQRVYTYTVEVKGCTGDPAPVRCGADGTCGTCLIKCPGHPYSGPPSGVTRHNVTQYHTVDHPIDHTWTYNVIMPIASFNYFDMQTSEVWRLSQWGLKGGNPFLANPNPTFQVGTKFWGLNETDYRSGNGRIVFNESMKSNENGDLAKFGDNRRTITVSGSAGEAKALQDALTKVNGAKNAEAVVKATAVSDHIVLKTSEGYQVPYFFSQEFDTTVKPGDASNFTGKGGNETTKTFHKVNKILTMDDLWWKNSSKSTCASRENGWNNTSITYAGYNGDYADLTGKYINREHDSFMSNDNPLEKMLQKNKLTINSYYPNQMQDGTGNTTMGRDIGNKDYIKTGFDVIDTTPNGEYDTGKSWVRYDRVMLYQNNSYRNPKSGTVGKFAMTGNGLWEDKNVPYFDGAEKVNDVVFHDPVSAEYSIVVSNDPKYDDRTNAKLMQGGDPQGLLGGTCPLIGCEHSTLNCKTPLAAHNNSCWADVVGSVQHVGGFNAHEHNASCYHTHTEVCYTIGGPITEQWSGIDYYTPSSIVVKVFRAPSDGTVYNFYSVNAPADPRGYIAINGSSVFDDDDSGGGLNFNIGAVPFKEGDLLQFGIYNYRNTPSSNCSWFINIQYTKPIDLTCGYTEGQLIGNGTVKTTGLEFLPHLATWQPPYWNINGSSQQISTKWFKATTGKSLKVTVMGVNIDYDTYVDLHTDGGIAPNIQGTKTVITGGMVFTLTPTQQKSRYTVAITDTGNGQVLSATIEGTDEITCLPNKHVCTAKCIATTEKVKVCSDPHHYEPGEPTDWNSHKYHHPLGDPRCWKRCGDDSKHGTPPAVTLPDGSIAKMGGTFINLDRGFEIYYPFKGDFAESPNLAGISETTKVRGKGFTNSMNTFEWTSHRWVYFPFNVIDPKGKMRLATTQIDLNEFSTTDEIFKFYCVLANSEASKAGVKFTTTAINAPVPNRNAYFDHSDGVTNKNRPDWKYGAKHTAAKIHYIDVVGYIGALTLHDTGDYRFANFFKQVKNDGSFIIPKLVQEVHLNRPNFIVSDKVTSRRDTMEVPTRWLDTYGKMHNAEGGKSGGTSNAKQPYKIPLVPRYNNITSLRNQPMRPGYQLYMDTETVGNYYGETINDEGNFLDTQMMSKMQIRPMYYSLDMKTKVYSPVDVYYGVNGEYMKVYDYLFNGTDEVGVQNYYYYLDWLNESARRNYTNAERDSTFEAKEFSQGHRFGIPTLKTRIPTAEKDVIGSANVLFLNDLNRTFIGSSSTYGVNNNPGGVLDERWYNMQSQRWHYTLGLPSSSVFVEMGKPCTEINIAKLQTKDRVIVCALDIKALGDVWALQYNGTTVNNDGFQIVDGGQTYQPPKFDKDGKPTTDPNKDVTTRNPIIIVYPPAKTSKDDVISSGIQ